MRAKPRVRVYKVGDLPSNTLIGCHQPNSTNFRASVFGRVLTVRRRGVSVETQPPGEALYRRRMAPFVDELKR
nr:MAG: hypothetical protein [Chemarfal virus 14]